ncbi:MAG: hypothetical protein IPM81_22885 [Saprospirales bacterium]|nr:hypothetical protein [Saprospirales bacterium]
MYAPRMVTPSQLYRSTNTGDNWTQIVTPTIGVGSRMVIGVSPADATYVYLVHIKRHGPAFKALLRSTDSGQTFSQQSNHPIFSVIHATAADGQPGNLRPVHRSGSNR